MTRTHRIVLTAALATGIALPGCAAESGVRQPAVAGAFYPADAKQLEAAVKGFLADAIPPKGERPIAIVAPHAGYIFSGQIAADAYRQAMGYPVDVVVILGTNHTVPQFDGVSVYQGTGYKTALGVARVDQEIAKALTAADITFAFRPEAHAKEHSEEVQIPFVQVAFPEAKIVTAVIGSSDAGLAARFGKVLARVLEGRKALIVASSDLSHYPTYADAVEVDRATLKAIASLDPTALTASIATQERKGRSNLVTCACGEAPILAAMSAARALGARRGIVVSYANSGDGVAGERDRVVGYGAVIFTAGNGGTDTKALDPHTVAPKSASLTEADRKFLLSFARKTLERWYRTGTLPLPRTDSPTLRRNQGAFVTLNIRGQLRGCIGQMTEDMPLVVTVAKMAIEAATQDPRFPPVRAEELAAIDLEISVLTPMSRIAGPDAIQIGRDGVLIEKAGRRAVFLPQVAREQGWNPDQMLGNLCKKAGLPGDCWKKDTTFYTFQADLFGEKKQN
jgi:AmmeMemoRadiSam system protein B/AmmeMemoRadiSam system protein A